MKLTQYEVNVLELMLAQELSPEDLKNFISSCEISSYEFTGAGYFLALKSKTFDLKNRLFINQR